MDLQICNNGVVANIQDEAYVYEPMSRSQLAELLQFAGDFLVHVSTDQGAINVKTHERILGRIYILSVMCKGNQIRHWLIKEEDGKFGVECVKFPSIQMMLQHYVESGKSMIQGESVFLSKPIVRLDEVALKLNEMISQCLTPSTVEDFSCNETPESYISERCSLNSRLCYALSAKESDESTLCECGIIQSDTSQISQDNCTQGSKDSDRDIAQIDEWFCMIDSAVQTSHPTLTPDLFTQTDSRGSPVNKSAAVNSDFPHVHLSNYLDSNDDMIRTSAIDAANFFEFVDVYESRAKKDTSHSTLSKVLLAAEALFAEYKQLVSSLSVDSQNQTRA
ncbi:hypothetical protein Ddc_15096 [Ditylenchus destructor]|nr:hypothetical protein Ddc_15096 [Ditylenchus destructor]